MSTIRDEVPGADLVDQAFDTPTEAEAEPPIAKSFQPWHKPRKHFIRLRQWCDEVKALISDLAKSRGGAAPERISYLTLPGDELLDVRVLHDACNAEGVSLRYLGFNTPKGRTRSLESNISQAEVHKLTNIDGPGSRMLHDRLEQITVEQSVANGAIRKEAPFDVINLDFCDSIAGDPPKTKGSTLAAIKKLLDVQRGLRALPWLLFVTTRVDKETIDGQVWDILLGVVSGNIAQSGAFADAIKRISLADNPASWKDDEATLHRAFIIGLGKWLLGLATSARPHWKVELVSSYGYAVRTPMDLVSISFRFELILEPTVDLAGLVETPRTESVDEPELATKLAANAALCRDVDRELQDDEHLLKDMIDQSAELLERVRYPADRYREWIARPA